jgi:hypothetical protein
LSAVYQKKIDADCRTKFNLAKVTWSAAQNPEGAEKVGDILSTINPLASCQAEIDAFIKTIDAKLKADEKAKWQFKMKQYADKIAAHKEQVRIAEEKGKRDDTYRENQSQRVAIAEEKKEQRNAIKEEKQSQRNYELDKLRVNTYRDVALEYAKNQPKTINYNNINWR